MVEGRERGFPLVSEDIPQADYVSTVNVLATGIILSVSGIHRKVRVVKAGPSTQNHTHITWSK